MSLPSKPDVVKRRGRPPKVITGTIKINNSPLYSTSEVAKEPNFNINNIIQLKLSTADIARLEQARTTPYGGDGYNNEIQAFNENTQTQGLNLNNLIRPDVQPVKLPPVPDLNARKDLIINDGVQRHAHPLMKVYADQWPTYTPYVCWVDCHTFDTTPVGIPHMLIGNDFHCYGNFCSYNCAMRYLCPEDEDDITMLNSTTDYFVNDDLSDKKQLLELLCHIETATPFFQPIKKAPRRLVLKIFGGTQTIEEYRANFQTHTNYHIFRSPMVPISYQMEECADKNEGRVKLRGVSITSQKLERAYINLLNANAGGSGSNTINKLLMTVKGKAKKA